MTARQADPPDIVLKSTLPIFDHLALVLFYLGSTHSFRSKEFVELAHLEKEPLEITQIVSTPAHELLLATHRVKGGCVTISGRVIEATLIVLSMQDFDVILGMDWLGENRALIDCKTRIVTLRLPSGDKLTYKGATFKRIPSIVTTLRAKKLIRNGTSAFLANVTLDNSNKQIASSVHIIREFVDVFLENLPDFSPAREVDFGIDLE